MASPVTEIFREFNHQLQSSIILKTFFIVLLTYWIVWIWKRRKFYYLSAKLPGPLWMPLIGNALQLKIYRPVTEFSENVLKLVNKYPSPMRIWAGFEFLVVISEADDLEELLTSKTFIYKDERYDAMSKCIGTGVVSTSGSLWKKRRQILNPAFCTSTLRSFHPNMNKHSRYLVKNLINICDKGFVETKQFTKRYVADAALESMFGIEKNFHKGEFDDKIELSVVVTELIVDRMSKFWQKWDFTYSLSHNSKLNDEYMATYRQFYHPIVREMIRNFIENKQIKGKVDEAVIKTPFSVLLNAHADGTMSEQDVIDEFDHIYNAAISTTFSQISFFMLMMGMHKDIQDKLQQEVQKALGNQTNDQLEITVNHLRQMPYLKMCAQENFRLFPTAPVATRTAPEDFVLKSKDLKIPAGTHLMVPSYVIHRNPKYWDKPYSYMPERFSPEECKKRPHYAYIPFHGGLRDCIGKNYAIDLVRIAGAHLVKNYEFHSDLKMEKLQLSSDMTTRSLHGYKVAITKRN